MAPCILIIAGTAMAWGAWFFVTARFDPFAGGTAIHALFYLSFAFALQGTLMLFGMLWHKRAHRMLPSRAAMGLLARQILLFNLFAIVVLNLAAHRLLKWWNIIPLAALTFIAELFFRSLTISSQRSTTGYAPKRIIR